MTAKAKFIGFFSVAFFAEVGASLSLLLILPTDNPIELYHSGLFDYEAGRALFWVPLVVLAALFFSFLGQRFLLRRDERRAQNPAGSRLFVLASISGLIVETLTSICYWKSSYSKGVRAVYEGVWYWQRVPRKSDYGWPSFRGYFLDHLILWAVIFVIGSLVWLLWSRRRRAAPPTMG
jgi:hypothetical protein